MTMMKTLSLLGFLAVLLNGAHATEQLNAETWKELIDSGKNGMIKFYQTWCGHCTRMKPDWDKLAENAHPSVFIADVNCGDEEELCKQNEVSGYPTIKVYKDGVDDKYNGGRGYEELLQYVDENLARKCDITAPDGCSEKAQKYIPKWQAKTAGEVTKEILRLQGMSGNAMTNDLKSWLRERIAILQQLEEAAVSS